MSCSVNSRVSRRKSYSANNNVPLELIENILLRLPIKDVVRSTSVCKSWYKLITSNSFISLHLNSSISNTQSRVMLSFYTKNDFKEHCFLHLDNQAFEELEELECPGNPDANIRIHGPSNGVYCCFGDRIFTNASSDRLTLWNPSLRKSLILPESKYAQLSKYQKHVVGFGFLPETNNFKVVRVTYTQNSEFKYSAPPQVEVYEFLTGFWRDVDVVDYSYVLDGESSQALLKGIVHWTAHNRVGGEFEGLIVSFDLTSEKFDTLMLPKGVQSYTGMHFFTVRTWGESLSLLYRGGIYIMKQYGITESWEKLLTFDYIRFRPLYLRENGEILAGLEDNDEEFENLVSCDPKTTEFMDLGVHKNGQYFREAYAYVDSLVLI